MKRIVRQSIRIARLHNTNKPINIPGRGFCASQQSSEDTRSNNKRSATKFQEKPQLDSKKETSPLPHGSKLQSKKISSGEKYVLMTGLKSCSASRDLSRGRKLHKQAIQTGHLHDLFVATALVDMFAKCGSMPEARQVFDSMLHRDVVSWNALILGYVENGQSDEALRLFETMQTSGGCSPTSRTLLVVLMAFTNLAVRDRSRHPELLERGLELYSRAGSHANNFVAAALVELCFKCGEIDRGREVFHSVPRPDVSLWNVYILGLVENGHDEEALPLLFGMVEPGPNARTVMAALLACGNLAAQEEATRMDGTNVKVAALRRGVAVHSLARRIGCDDHNFVGNCLIDMYSRCGSVVEARRVFDGLTNKTVITWTAMMVGYELNGEDELALELFSAMRSDPQGCEPDERTVVAALTACASSACREAGELVEGKLVKLESLRKGMDIHRRSRRMDIFIATSLIDMYAKCGSLEDARRVFDAMDHRDVAAWNVLIAGHAEGGESERALEFFDRMREEGVCAANSTTLVAALTACIDLASRDDEKSVFVAEKDGGGEEKPHFDGREEENSVIYAEKGENPVFDGRREEKLVFDTAKGVFDGLRGEKSVLEENERSRCLRRGMELHRQAKELDCETDMSVANALVELYARCGSLAEMWTVFNSMPSRNVSAWTAIILGHVQAGDARTALEIFHRMQLEDHCVPKMWTFSCALKACMLLLDFRAGRTLHSAACRVGADDSISLETLFMEFYGKCGKPVQAHRVFDSLLVRDSLSWNTLLSSYSVDGNAELVFHLFDEFLAEENVPVTAATFVILLTTCSHAGLVDRGKKYFHSMRSMHGVEPGLEHYNCMIDMLGRANKVAEALEVAETMPVEANALTWRSLLSACQTWKNVEVGKLAFDALVKMDDKDSAGYVLMSNIYASQSGG